MNDDPDQSFARPVATAGARSQEHAAGDRAAVHAILDEALYCHVGFVDAGRPVMMAVLQARIGDTVYLHGPAAGQLVECAGRGGELCVTATLLDGVVLARSWCAHSLNYRTAVVSGPGRVVTELVEKARALRAMVEHLAPGRSREARPPTPKEMGTTPVVAVALDRAWSRVRKGLPRDLEDDYVLPVWAGEIPLQLQPLAPVTDPRVDEAVGVPTYVRSYGRPGLSVQGQRAAATEPAPRDRYS